MEKVHYPGIINPNAKPAAPAEVPAIEIPVGAKTAPKEKEVTLKEAVDQLRVNLQGIALKRRETMLLFAEKRDAKIEEPNHEEALQRLIHGMKFLDNQQTQMLNMYISGKVLMKTDPSLEADDHHRALIDEYNSDLPELKADRADAIVSLIKLATDPKARMTQREVMVLATFADYYQFHQKLDI